MGVKLGFSSWRKNEEYRLKEFENRMLRKIFGPEKSTVRGGW
jgi:hypothetical protein